MYIIFNWICKLFESRLCCLYARIYIYIYKPTTITCCYILINVSSSRSESKISGICISRKIHVNQAISILLKRILFNFHEYSNSLAMHAKRRSLILNVNESLKKRRRSCNKLGRKKLRFPLSLRIKHHIDRFLPRFGLKKKFYSRA